jgi:rhodanese-related sulfurtransferase/rubrerythrin
MNILHFFKPVKSITVDEARAFMKGKGPDDYNLIDVRQPSEYERGHLPGAHLIPLREVAAKAKELDPEKTSVVYCASGVRSRSATSLLSEMGFRDVSNISGGIKAWQGQVATGPPEAGMAYFSAATGPEELLALAWSLEEGSRRFYVGAAEILKDDGEAVRLLQTLVAAEAQHKQKLLSAYGSLIGADTDIEGTLAKTFEGEVGDVMEGGVSVKGVLAWAAGKNVPEILELAMAMEVNAYDLYVKMGRRMTEGPSKQIFGLLIAEEQTHLNMLSEMMDHRL